MIKKVYAEIGIGNQTFLSTEIESGRREVRIPKFILPENIRGVYFRLWIMKKVFILSSREGIKFKRKDKNRLKILFGIQGVN